MCSLGGFRQVVASERHCSVEYTCQIDATAILQFGVARQKLRFSKSGSTLSRCVVASPTLDCGSTGGRSGYKRLSVAGYPSTSWHTEPSRRDRWRIRSILSRTTLEKLTNVPTSKIRNRPLSLHRRADHACVRRLGNSNSGWSSSRGRRWGVVRRPPGSSMRDAGVLPVRSRELRRERSPGDLHEPTAGLHARLQPRMRLQRHGVLERVRRSERRRVRCLHRALLRRGDPERGIGTSFYQGCATISPKSDLHSGRVFNLRITHR